MLHDLLLETLRWAVSVASGASRWPSLGAEDCGTVAGCAGTMMRLGADPQDAPLHNGALILTGAGVGVQVLTATLLVDEGG